MSATVTPFSGPLLDLLGAPRVSPASRSLRASSPHGLPASPPRTRRAKAPERGGGRAEGCCFGRQGWEDWLFGSRGVYQREENRKLAAARSLSPPREPVAVSGQWDPASAQSAERSPRARGHGGAALGCGSRLGAQRGWARREPGRLRSPAVEPPLLPGCPPLGREAGAAEPRRAGRERAHLYWSNLAYTAHSAGLLS